MQQTPEAPASNELPKAYQPQAVEEKWYAAWEDAGAFKPREDVDDAYCIMIPPPNVTGILTMGHVLNNTLQDVLVRRARQQGKSVLWLPGTDHAGIATQTKVERALKEAGTSKHELGRDGFVKRAESWRDEHGGIILNQLKKLGASCDWSRTVHTLDEGYSEAVLSAFVKLYKKGYIYRGKRMVNWCPVQQTAISDEEVIPTPQQSKLYKLRYEIVEHPGQYVEISTTRPETIPGDSGVAIHPSDERYTHLHGCHVWRPLNPTTTNAAGEPEAEQRAQLPFVLDRHVDTEFGTGVLKVTPAHDKADFEIGARHGLEAIDIMHADGRMNELAGPQLDGLDRFKARKKAAELLEAQGALIEIEAYENNVGFSERGGVAIEPRLSDQWFMRYPKVAEAKRAVSEGHITFWPQRWEKTYMNWMDNIQDWCISRQIWWGHRIPVWYAKGTDLESLTEADYQNANQPGANVHVSLAGPADPENWVQDADTLDTWASSWLWPFATLGWPNEQRMSEQGLSKFYTTDDLVTGPDIIFFWVARMIVAGLEFMDGDSADADAEKDNLQSKKNPLSSKQIAQRIPFKNVYFTGIIRDDKGRKMSKSLGNSPDPLDLIAQYGADGLRFGILSIAPKGQDIRFAQERIAQGRNFCNKLWNAARFRQMQSAQAAPASELTENNPHLDADDQAILTSLVNMVSELENAYSNYAFNAATQALYKFFWNDFCDGYLEASKPRMQGPAAATCLAVQDVCLQIFLQHLHPFAPFITEELYGALGFAGENKENFLDNITIETADALAARLPTSETAAQQIERERTFVSEARALKAEYKLANKQDIEASIEPADAAAESILKTSQAKLLRLCGFAQLKSLTQSPTETAAVKLTALGTLHLNLAAAINPQAERARLSKELEKLTAHIASTEKRLASPAFTEKAPEHVVAGARAQLEHNKTNLAETKRLLEAL